MGGQGGVVEQQIYRGPRGEGRELPRKLDGLGLGDTKPVADITVVTAAGSGPAGQARETLRRVV
jgi:hypothetical protein